MPTTLVGSYPQPEWLIDRERLAGRFPPRVRARELWRVPEPYLAEAQDDATLLAIKAQEDAGLDIITDGEIRRESYSNLFATALDGVDLDNPGTALDRSGHPNPVPRVVGAIRRRHAVGVRDLKFLRSNTQRRVKVTVPGPFTMAQQAQIDYYGGSREHAAMDYAAAVNERDPRPVRSRRRRRADRRALHAGATRRGARLRAQRPEPRARRRRRDHRGAHLLRLRGHHPRAPVRLFIPAGARRVPLRSRCRSRLRSRVSTARCSSRCPARRSSSVSSTSRTTNVETPELVASRIRRALPFVDPGDLLVAPDCGMKYLPREVAFGKLRAMVAGAQMVRRELEAASGGGVNS